jgi:Ca2+-transporting ATPase
MSTGTAVGERVGLTSGEAARRLSADGPNVVPPARRARLAERVLSQLRDPLVIVLLVAAVLTIATGDWTDAGVILLVVVVNTAAGVTQEVRADQAIAALGALRAPEARVVRDGRESGIASRDLVVGDLLVLTEGAIVPADAVVVDAAGLLVDEAALTGESEPVAKEPASPLAAGTAVVRGRCLAVVTATGPASAMGRIAALMDTAPAPTPLQRRLAELARVLALAAVALSAVVMVVGLARGQGVELMVVTAISLAVAAVPESLPAVITLALALGARRMAARHALVRGLPAVETLGSVTVLATDKTGTLTEGTMAARALWTPVGEATVAAAGPGSDGLVSRDGRPVTADDAPDLDCLLTAGALCNDATAAPAATDGGRPRMLGDPTEAALLLAALALGRSPLELHERFPRLAEAAFDSARRRMTTLHRRPGGGTRVICKGAPEALLHASVLADDQALIDAAARRAEEFARDGYRVLAVAAADRPGELDRQAEGAEGEDGPLVDQERDLHLLGLVAIVDPPRASAAATIASCRSAGIVPVLITGDHPGTARSVATALGIIAAGDLVTDGGAGPAGDEIGPRGSRVFARASPARKLELVEALRAAGNVVAMTGDGVNDGPALRRADIGVAMGGRGSEVARQAADLVLADDELGTVVSAVEEGRRVYGNIRRFLLYALAGGSAEILVMLIGPLVGLSLPLLPAQILWINLITHGLPGVALGGEPVEPGAMLRAPRPPAESVVGAGLWQRVPRVGAVIAALTLGVALWGHATGRPWQSMAFFTLGATQLAVALASRARPATAANPLLLVAVTGALLAQIAGLYVPFLRDLLGTHSLAGADLLILCAVSALGYVALKADRLIFPERRPLAPRPSPAIHPGRHERGRKRRWVKTRWGKRG